MNVLVISPNYPSQANPQAGIFIHRQLRQLANLGHRITVLVCRPAGSSLPRGLLRRSWWKSLLSPVPKAWDYDGIPVQAVEYVRTGGTDEDVVPAMGRALTNHVARSRGLQSSDVIYSHFLWTAGAAALVLAQDRGWPCVAIARGSELNAWQVSRPHCRGHVISVMEHADQVLANCGYLKSEAMLQWQADRPGQPLPKSIEVIRNGCDADFFAPAHNRQQVRAELHWPAETRYLLYCGSIEHVKGLDILAKAWTAFSASRPHWKLVAVGKQTDRSLVNGLKDAAGDALLLTGNLPPASVLTYMQAADLYVQPSRLEGLANATMEAMAVGLPVVATRTCGQVELIQDRVNGRLVSPDNVAELSAALANLADAPREATAYGRAARETIVQHFCPFKQVEQLQAVLQEVVRRKTSLTEKPHAQAVVTAAHGGAA